jgi:isochorismate hydrolase
MNKDEIIKISAEIITETWPSCYSSDWQFPKKTPLYFRNKCIKNSADLQERMKQRAVRLRAALQNKEEITSAVALLQEWVVLEFSDEPATSRYIHDLASRTHAVIARSLPQN